MIFNRHNYDRVIFKENVVHVPPNKVANSIKRKAANGAIKVLIGEELHRPLKVFKSRLVSPREIAFSRPKESHVGSDATHEVEIIDGILCQPTKSTNLSPNFAMRHK